MVHIIKGKDHSIGWREARSNYILHKETDFKYKNTNRLKKWRKYIMEIVIKRKLVWLYEYQTTWLLNKEYYSWLKGAFHNDKKAYSLGRHNNPRCYTINYRVQMH